jgi:hypothetical protein
VHSRIVPLLLARILFSATGRNACHTIPSGFLGVSPSRNYVRERRRRHLAMYC